jgi:hypothetical protein
MMLRSARLDFALPTGSSRFEEPGLAGAQSDKHWVHDLVETKNLSDAG